jgi:PKD repeat protein
MMANTTVYPALGNHEANHTNYYETYGVPQWYSFDCAGAHFSILDTNSEAWDRMPEQSAWLADDLAGASGSQWRFAAFHHPPYSSERNHFGGWENVRTEWEDEFMSYGVNAVFSGHVHAYERFLANGIHYLVVATGGGPSYNLVSPRAPFSMNSLEYALAYAKVTIDPAWGIATIEIIRVADISGDLREVTTVYPAGTIFETVTLGTLDVPVAEFTANTTAGPAPLTVQFTDRSTGYGITGRTWDFEDDSTIDSWEQDPVHTYTAAGRYTVNMTVTNAAGSSTEVKRDYITVTTPGGTVLSVNPPTSLVLRGKTTTIQVVIGPLPEGLAGYNLSLDLSDPAMAEITGLSFPGWAPMNSASTLPADQLVFSAVDLETVVGPGAGVTVLADIAIRGEAPGTTDLILGIDRITAHRGDPIIPEIISGSLSVHLVEPFPGYTDRPTDPDGDGLYEDINGNGVLEFDDVVAFYQNMAWVAGNTAVGIEPYDFNRNGRIDYDDVVVLYYRILER